MFTLYVKLLKMKSDNAVNYVLEKKTFFYVSRNICNGILDFTLLKEDKAFQHTIQKNIYIYEFSIIYKCLLDNLNKLNF